MNNTGQNGEKTGYRVILLLVVALAAFSSAMKELNQIQQLALDANLLAAHWSNRIAPTEPQPVIVKAQTCGMKQSPPAVELPWLAESRPAASEEMNMLAERGSVEIEKSTRSVIAHRPRPGGAQIAQVKKLRVTDVDEIDPVQFEVRLPSVHEAGADDSVIPDLPLSLFKAKNRKHGAIRISPRDREMLLKLNRSINLRIAS